MAPRPQYIFYLEREYNLDIIIGIYIFAIGLCIGSFLNVVIYRLPLEIFLVKGRSYCPTCKHQLNYKDLFPLLSYIFLKGRCRYCKSKISIRYLLIELVTGIFYVLLLIRFGISWDLLFYMILISILLCIVLIDYDCMIIPNKLVIALIIPAVISMIIYPEITIVSRMIGFFVVSVPMYVLACVIDGAFGGGDIKLMAVAGFILGWQNTLVAMFIGIMLGGIYAIIALSCKKIGFKQHFAFGPALCVAIYIAANYGNDIITWYLQFF